MSVTDNNIRIKGPMHLSCIGPLILLFVHIISIHFESMFSEMSLVFQFDEHVKNHPQR